MVSGAAAQADYQVEANAGYRLQSYDYIDYSQFEFGGKYYLESVADNKLFAESAFLDKSSHIEASYTHYSWDFENVFGRTVESDDFGYFAVGGRYILEQNQSFIIEGGASFGDIDTFSAAGGLYLDETTEVVAGLVISDAEGSLFVSDAVIGDTFFGRVKTIRSLGGFEDIVAEATAMVIEGDLGAKVSADYYLNEQLRVGVETGVFFHNDTLFPVEARAQYKINENFIADASFGFTDLFEFDIAFSAGITGRF